MNGGTVFDLRSWLRRLHRPASLRIHTGDGEERIIDLGDKRFRWNACEETVRAAGAVKVEALDKDGKIGRGTRIAEDDASSGNDEEAQEKYSAKILAGERREMGAMFDRYGHGIKEAYLAGSTAASASQDKLVDLVEVLTQHLSLAITNLHNVSVNLANIVQEAAQGEGGRGDSNGALLGAVLTQALVGAVQAEPPSKGAKRP